MKHLSRFSLSLILLPLVSCSSTASSWPSVGSYYGAMDTNIAIELRDPSNLVSADDIYQLFFTYDHLATNTTAYAGLANVYTINQTNEPVAVSSALFNLLKFAWEMKSETNGYFNPLIGGLADLWKKDLFNTPAPGQESTGVTSEAFQPSVPSTAEIEAELAKMNASSLVFDESKLTVQRLGEGEIDLGGVAKGYAGMIAKKYLADKNVSQYLVNAGSSTVLLGENYLSNQGTFAVDFKGITGKYTVVKNICLGTSAMDQQNVTIDGKLYSHVINPVSGSALVDWYGVVLAGDDAGVLDALSTTFMILGPDASETLRQKYGISAMFYKADLSSLVNEGFTLNDK
jgi:FAD:protein FMN transferase